MEGFFHGQFGAPGRQEHAIHEPLTRRQMLVEVPLSGLFFDRPVMKDRLHRGLCSMENASPLRIDSRDAIERAKLARLEELLAEVLPANAFYAAKLAGIRLPPTSLAELQDWPTTSKQELADAAATGRPANLSFEPARYVRFHQTSGSHGLPMPVFDTADDWRWWMACWQEVLDRGGVGPGERVLVASSFGPYAGFWSGFDAVIASGGMAIPAGGLSTAGRLDLARRTSATVLMATPSYCLHLAEVAADRGIDAAGLGLRLVIVAGEPGGSVAEVRRRIGDAFAAEVLDHAGATEVGPWGVGDLAGEYLEVLEPWFHPEFLSLESGEPAAEGELAELVLTTLGRAGCPVIRYRTGDLVRAVWPDRGEQGRPPRVRLAGGVLGRADDMLVVRGVNLFPSAIDAIVRGFPEVLEYRVVVDRRRDLDELRVEVEDRADRPERIAEELHLRLGLRCEVVGVPRGSLPRFEGKGRRFIVEQ
jgi:phenylacetate-CoA ligase